MDHKREHITCTTTQLYDKYCSTKFSAYFSHIQHYRIIIKMYLIKKFVTLREILRKFECLIFEFFYKICKNPSCPTV